MSAFQSPNEPRRNITASTPRSEPPIAQPTRSKTDLPSTTTATVSKPERTSRRPHAHSLRNKVLPGSTSHQHGPSPSTAGTAGHKSHHSVRHAARNTVQSAIELKAPMTFEHLLRRDRGRNSFEAGRGGSTGAEKEKKEREKQDWDFAQAQGEAERRARVSGEDVVREKGKNETREVQLRGMLKKVEELGMQRTRELDDAYYSILEKAEGLRDAVAGLQGLAEESAAARTKFGEEVKELESSVGGVLEGFGEFKQQESEVDDLVERLKSSKQRTETLNERLEGARKRVETYEWRFLQRRAMRRRQWGITWGSVVAAVAVLLALVVAKNHRQLEFQVGGLGKGVIKVGDLVEGFASPVVQMVKPRKSEDPVLEKMFEGVV